jgi:endonuclease/exonuclease/phosphatase family metal-dependent hydrolase
MHKGFAMSFCRYVASLVAVLLIGLGVLIYWAVGKQLPASAALEVGPALNIPATEPPQVLNLVSYNMGHGQGIKEQAWDYRDQQTTLNQLALLGTAIKNMNADIVLLQEVDIDSRRTFRINQIDYIRERTGHKYYACANVWEKNYLPFPYWPPTHHLGYIRAANCVLSRFPLSNHSRIIFDKPKSNPFWYNLGYIDRGIQRVDVLVGDKKLVVLNLHLEAWDIETREEQIKKTLEYAKQQSLPVIMGGDFNTVPPNAHNKNNFADDSRANYTQENTLAWLFAAEPQLKKPMLNTEIFTFPSDNPNRQLDHIFLLGNTLAFESFRVVNEAGIASDHLPVMAEITY